MVTLESVAKLRFLHADSIIFQERDSSIRHLRAVQQACMDKMRDATSLQSPFGCGAFDGHATGRGLNEYAVLPDHQSQGIDDPLSGSQYDESLSKMKVGAAPLEGYTAPLSGYNYSTSWECDVGESLLGQYLPRLKMFPPGVDVLRTTKVKVYTDDSDRMVYVSWIPKKARAFTVADKRKMELDLKKKLREGLMLYGLAKVLLFPPQGVHCKLIFESRKDAAEFMIEYGGENCSRETERWKIHMCKLYDIDMHERFDRTVVKIEWSQK